MYDFTQPVANLVNELRKIPGIGTKSAQRIAFHLLKTDKDKVLALSDSINNAMEKTRFCKICNNITEFEICEICEGKGRDITKICVVEEPFNILSIERTGLYKGMYHVLSGNLSPIRGIGPDELKISSLERRLDSGETEEVIIATSPTVEGNATAIFIFDLLKKKSIKITRIAMGLPIGADLDYVDSVTIAKSFEGRIEFK
ncbi:MAG: recombination protein RecR [Candidatus Aminicenantes bacterium]|nr:recombination protein RecR [Candidatus Aminicenantes bacterium]